MAEKKFFDMDAEERLADLKLRVNQFDMLQLPGQIQAMHMGTSYLIGDLFSELQLAKRDLFTELKEGLEEIRDRGPEESLADHAGLTEIFGFPVRLLQVEDTNTLYFIQDGRVIGRIVNLEHGDG